MILMVSRNVDVVDFVSAIYLCMHGYLVFEMYCILCVTVKFLTCFLHIEFTYKTINRIP